MHPLTFYFLGSQPGYKTRDLTAWYLVINVVWVYSISSSRALKMLYGIDNHVNPRSDLDKTGPRAVLESKITQAQLDMMKRNEAAHANSMDNFVVFATALTLAKVAGLPASDINWASLVYTLLRLAYWGNYVFSTTLSWAALRPLFWWGGNIVCLRLIWQAGKVFNGNEL